MKFLILAGGVGSRLWPLSSKKTPKQFQNFISKKTLLVEAYDRLSFTAKSNIFISTNKEYYDLIKQQLPDISDINIILEPELKDTGPCISFGMKYLESLFGPNETVSIIYADHLIKDAKTFKEKQLVGHKIAKENDKFVIIEVKATSANPNLGYVKIGKSIKQVGETEIFELDKFIEKPDLANATKYYKSIDYLWNTGYYIWKIETYFKNLQKHSPETFKVLSSVKNFKKCEKEYKKFEKISLDYMLMEKINPKNVWIIPAEFGWSDIGTWQTLFSEMTENESANLKEGKVFEIGTKGSIIINKEKNKKLVCVNLENLVIINTKDAILVCNKNDDKDIKKILWKLK